MSLHLHLSGTLLLNANSMPSSSYMGLSVIDGGGGLTLLHLLTTQIKNMETTSTRTANDTHSPIMSLVLDDLTVWWCGVKGVDKSSISEVE